MGGSGFVRVQKAFLCPFSWACRSVRESRSRCREAVQPREGEERVWNERLENRQQKKQREKPRLARPPAPCTPHPAPRTLRRGDRSTALGWGLGVLGEKEHSWSSWKGSARLGRMARGAHRFLLLLILPARAPQGLLQVPPLSPFLRARPPGHPRKRERLLGLPPEPHPAAPTLLLHPRVPPGPVPRGRGVKEPEGQRPPPQGAPRAARIGPPFWRGWVGGGCCPPPLLQPLRTPGAPSAPAVHAVSCRGPTGVTPCLVSGGWGGSLAAGAKAGLGSAALTQFCM